MIARRSFIRRASGSLLGILAAVYAPVCLKDLDCSSEVLLDSEKWLSFPMCEDGYVPWRRVTAYWSSDVLAKQ